MATKFVVSSDQMEGIVGKCLEIQRQARLDGGSPYDPDAVNRALQAIIEGRFPGARGAAQASSAATGLLEQFAAVDVGSSEAFKAADFFVEEKQPHGIRFLLSDNFKKHFLRLNKTGKIELDVPAATLIVHRLREASFDKPILAELGRQEAAEVSLAYMAELIQKQANGKDGILLTDGYANIFYVRDDSGELWAVRCDGNWDSDDREWLVEASPLTDLHEWDAGDQVFSR